MPRPSLRFAEDLVAGTQLHHLHFHVLVALQLEMRGRVNLLVCRLQLLVGRMQVLV